MSDKPMSDKPKFTTWVKENKTEIKLNNAPATIAQAQANGWKRKAGRKAAE